VLGVKNSTKGKQIQTALTKTFLQPIYPLGAAGGGVTDVKERASSSLVENPTKPRKTMGFLAKSSGLKNRYFESNAFETPVAAKATEDAEFSRDLAQLGASKLRFDDGETVEICVHDKWVCDHFRKIGEVFRYFTETLYDLIHVFEKNLWVASTNEGVMAVKLLSRL
jgi:hypothetical protein